MNTIIIGSGPAGYTAAIYAARADLKPIIYTGLEPGGQLTTTTEVDNFPGYPSGVDGPTMMNELREQAETPPPISFCSLGRPRYLAEAPVHIIIVFVCISSPF